MRKRNATSQGTGHEPEQQQRGAGLLVLNDQGGGVMSVSYEVTATLRAEMHSWSPIVLVYESHGQDCRYKPLGEICSTISQKYGTGGGNAPIVVKYETEDISEHRARVVE